MIRIQVSDEQVREVPIYRYELDAKTRRHKRTDVVLDTKVVTRNRVLFSGSHEAFEIWKKGHFLPATAKIERWRKKNGG